MFRRCFVFVVVVVASFWPLLAVDRNGIVVVDVVAERRFGRCCNGSCAVACDRYESHL